MSFAALQESKLFSRISNYSPVSALVSTTQRFYLWGKEASPTLAYVDDKIQDGLQRLAPIVLDPLLQNSAYKNYAQPLLLRVDDAGDSTLDVFESQIETVKTKLQNGKETVEKTVDGVKDSAFSTVKRFGENLFPIDDYLAGSVFGKPLHFVVDVGELLVTKYIPGEPEDDEREGDSVNPQHVGGKQQQEEYLPSQEEVAVQSIHNGPVVRAGRLSLLAYDKLHRFSTRTLDRQNPMNYVLGLVQHAAQTLDKGVAAVKVTGTNLITETPPKVGQKIQAATHEALAAVQIALETIANQIPSSISTKLQSSLDTNGHLVSNEGVFTNVAQRSSTLLHDVSAKLSVYVQKGEAIPKQLLHSSIANLYQVLHSLQNIVSKSHTTTDGKEVIHAEDDQDEFL